MYDHKPDLNKPTPIELAARLVLGNPNRSDCAWAAAMLRDFHATLTARESELADAQRQREHYYKACVSHEAKIAEAAATALGYPRYCDMEPINPDNPADVESQSKDTNRFYGEHVSETLVDELCRKYAEAQRRVAELEDMHRKIVDGIEWTMTNIADDMRCATPETDPWCKSLKRVHDLLVAVRKALLPPDRITHIPGKEDDDGEMH